MVGVAAETNPRKSNMLPEKQMFCSSSKEAASEENDHAKRQFSNNSEPRSSWKDQYFTDTLWRFKTSRCEQVESFKTGNCNNVLLKVVDYLLERNNFLKLENAHLLEQLNTHQRKTTAEVLKDNAPLNSKDLFIKKADKCTERENIRDFSSTCESVKSNDSANESLEETDKTPWRTARKRRPRKRKSSRNCQLRKVSSETRSENASSRTENSSSGNEGKTLRINCISEQPDTKIAENKHWKPCKYCGTIHKWGSEYCPSYGKCCTNCGKQNHIAKVCEKSHTRKCKHAGNIKVGSYKITRKNKPSIMIIAVYDDATMEYIWYQYPVNSIHPVERAREMMKCIRKFAFSGDDSCQVEVLFGHGGIPREVVHWLRQFCKDMHISENLECPSKAICSAIKNRIKYADIRDEEIYLYNENYEKSMEKIIFRKGKEKQAICRKRRM